MQTSANKKVIIEVAFDKSLIKNLSNGHKKLACGIPKIYGNLLEFTFDTFDK